jgi:DNA polymerase-3 subunit delta'
MDWNILGHESAIRYFKSQTKAGNTRHAYLIVGPDGVGRRTLALAFAKALNCTQAPQEGDFCDECLACRQINEQRYADLTVLEVEEGSKDIKIDQVRDMQQTLALSPYQSRFRMVLIPDFQRATIGASNALLKSLEEPPSKALLILTADAKESLLETIASRCEVIRLRPSPIEKLESFLKEEKGLEAKLAKKLAHLAAGKVGTALSYSQDPQSLDDYTEALEDLNHLLKCRLRHRLQYIEKNQAKKGNQREKFAFLIATWLSFWRDVMIRHEKADIPLVNLDQVDLIEETAGLMNSGQIEKILKVHETSLGQLDANLNPRLVIENLLLELPVIG